MPFNKLLLTDQSGKVRSLSRLCPEFLVQSLPGFPYQLTASSPLYPYGLHHGSLLPHLVIPRDKLKLISSLTRRIADFQEIWLDLESTYQGEYLAEQLRLLLPVSQIYRIAIEQLDSEGIQQAFKNPLPFNRPWADAYLARVAVNSIYSTLVREILSKSEIGLGPASISLALSHMLGLLIQREQEIQDFQPTIITRISANLAIPEKVIVHSLPNLASSKISEGLILEQQDQGEVRVPPPPLWTRDSLLGTFPPVATQEALQFLYHIGWISIPNDQPIVPLRYIDPKDTLFQGHILEIYSAIYQRWAVSQEEDGIYRQTSYLFSDEDGNPFFAFGKELVRAGWWSLVPESQPHFHPLPSLKIGSLYNVKHLRTTRERSKPPSRYAPSSLFATFPNFDLPSRFEGLAQLHDLKYSTLKNGKIYLNGLSYRCYDILHKYFEVDIKEIESDIIRVANGANYHSIVSSWEQRIKEMHQEALIETRKKMLRRAESWNLAPCPFCQADCIRYFRNDSVFIFCSTFPECKFQQVHPGKEAGILGKCEKCSGYLVNSQTKHPYAVCSRYPRCFNKRNLKPEERAK